MQHFSLKINIFILLFLITPHCIYSEPLNSFSDSLFFFNTNQVFNPTESSISEAKTGITKYTDKKNLRLDIGVSMDIIGLKNKNTIYSMGADFFTFSNLRSESNFKFPVDAIDYMFGLNFNFRKTISSEAGISGRLRISHISSHFEDGHIYERSDTIFTPVVFSKEYIDLASALDLKLKKNLILKIMPAVNIIFHSIPENISVLSGQLGLQIRYYPFKKLSVYLSNDIYLSKVNSDTKLSENFEAGISIGEINSRTINLFYTYYDGHDYRGQYYGKYLNNNGIGARIKF